VRRAFHHTFLALLCAIPFSIAAAQALYAAALLLWAALVVRERRLEFTVPDLIMLAFFAVRLLTILLSEHPSASAAAFGREVLFYPFYFIAVSYVRWFGREGVMRAMTFSIAAIIVPSLYAVGNVLTGTTDRGASFSGGYTFFAVHSAVILGFAAVLAADGPSPKLLRWLLPAALVIIAGLISTYTRAMWLSAAAVVVVFALLKERRLLYIILPAAVIAFAAVPSLRERAVSLMDPLQNSSGRMELWTAAVERIPLHPFLGYGPETFDEVIGDRSLLPDTRVGSWHSEFLQVQVESGAAGSMLLLTLYVLPVWTAFRLRRSQHGDAPFGIRFVLFTFLAFIPAAAVGTVMAAILNGMLFKFVLAAASVLGAGAGVLPVRRIGREAA